MEEKTDILTRIFEPSPQQCQTPREDVQLAITLNPDLSKIEQAMEEYAQQPLTEETEEGLTNWVGELLPPKNCSESENCLIASLCEEIFKHYILIKREK
ncbi:MAG: hypothetical protein WC346_02885 [Methanogenium sp.]|jgi:uncharacterized protein